MNTFDDRKKSFEAKFAVDQEIEFKIRSKRNQIVGEWAAEKLNPDNIEDYIKEVRLSDLEKPGDDDIIDKLISDFKKKSINIDREEIKNKIDKFEIEARSYFKEK